MPNEYDSFSDAIRANPYVYYKALRDEAPVYRCQGTGAWHRAARWRAGRSLAGTLGEFCELSLPHERCRQ